MWACGRSRGQDAGEPARLRRLEAATAATIKAAAAAAVKAAAPAAVKATAASRGRPRARII